ncbi:outer membrane beta-barrel protein [Salmonirosea aquatica]|uniref:Outer membrane beta-barrel protein n=1 Tax=Salmonirosea aquatica TaxID=2654236 RepID=A0A7C9FRQ1_9BACT|nr:outer membrane beta-barrel protein [Cytophagaceae bacterium SJW1-29]
MKSTLKTIVLSVVCLLSFVSSYAKPAQKDSIIVTFGDKTRIIIYSDDRKELEKLMKYDLNTLLQDLGARLDTMQGETKIYFDDLDGRKYLKDTTGISKDKNYVRIGLKGIRIKDGDTEVTITTRGVDIRDGDEQVRVGGKRDGYEIDTTARDGNGSSDRDYDNDEKVMTIRRVRRYSSPRKGFNISLGLNAYAQNQPQAAYNSDDYDLRPFGSRYISLGFVKSATLVRGKQAGLHLDFGLDVAWNNLMFEGNNTVRKDSTAVSFPLVLNNEGRELDLRKSKLTVPYLNFSLMPTVSFPNAFISYISAGGYIGYRLGGYTKTKLADGKKDHVRSNYYLNDLRYGAAFELGIRHFPDFFVHYDMNPLFQSNRGPEVRMINFGIRF